MSRQLLTEVFAATCPWLVLVLCLQQVANRFRWQVRGWNLLLVPGAIAALVLLLPIGGLAIARWVAAVSANFSIPLSSVLAVAVWERAFARAAFSEKDWTTAWIFGAVAGLAIYPLALGLSSFDPYEWGWRFSPLFIVIGALTAQLIWKQNRFGFVLLLAVIAFQLRLLESSNYWDYLVDPIYCLVSLGWSAGRLATSTRSSLTKRYSSTRPRANSMI
jgi:hypothetical protein